MKSPLEDLGLAPHDEDFCACLHYRRDHVNDDDEKPLCIACRDSGIKAVAYPWHLFHLMFPHQFPALTPRYVAFYSPPHGWDRPASPCQ